MKVQSMDIVCGACGEYGKADIAVECSIKVAAAVMKEVRCAKCGSKKVSFGGARPVEGGGSVEERALRWISTGSVGISSKTIWSVLTNAANGHTDVPHDPDDFSRCKALLDLIPEWRARLGEVAQRYSKWKPFVENWTELEQMFEQLISKKSNSGKAMYDRMQEFESQRRPTPSPPSSQPQFTERGE